VEGEDMKTEITRSLLVQKYLVEGKGSPTIAKETGWTKPYILKKLREFKIPRRKLSEYYEDLSGKKIGKLTVIEPVVSKNTRSARTWKCQCDCGNFCEVDSDKIKRRKKNWMLHVWLVEWYSAKCLGFGLGIRLVDMKLMCLTSMFNNCLIDKMVGVR
jgi:hypothetical protein